MLYLGLNDKEKEEIINEYKKEHKIKNVWTISGIAKESVKYDDNNTLITFKESINYVYYYDILQNFDNKGLLVLDEVLCDKNRYCLNYNCIRTYTKKSPNILIFNYLPIIENKDDFLILKDFNNPLLLRDKSFDNIGECQMVDQIPKFKFKIIELSKKELSFYKEKKEEMLNNIGIKDPSVVPSHLHKALTKFKLNQLDKDKIYLACNKISRANIKSVTYTNPTCLADIVLEFPTSFKKFTNYLRLFEVQELKFFITDAKVDEYLRFEFTEWQEEVKYIYEKIRTKI